MKGAKEFKKCLLKERTYAEKYLRSPSTFRKIRNKNH